MPREKRVGKKETQAEQCVFLWVFLVYGIFPLPTLLFLHITLMLIVSNERVRNLQFAIGLLQQQILSATNRAVSRTAESKQLRQYILIQSSTTSM